MSITLNFLVLFLKPVEAEVIVMFIDDVVLAGLITVGGTVVFLAAVAIFVYQDSHRKKPSK